MENIIHQTEQFMYSLDDMALFVEVAKAKGFSKAADYLKLPKSTLSVRINKLEKALGLQLLNRTTRKVELTEAGQLYFDRAVKIIEEARLAHIQLSDMLESPQGTLKISLPVDFAYHFIAPVLREFGARYPHIAFDFDVTPRKVDLIAEPFDLAIRAGELQDSTLVARRLTTLESGLYASPDYLRRAGRPQAPEDLSHHQCLRFHADYNFDWRLTNGGQERTVGVQGKYFTNSLGMMLQLAANGLGIAVLPDLIAKNAVTNGRLERILPRWQGGRRSVYALTATRLLPRKTQVFIDFLQEKLGER